MPRINSWNATTPKWSYSMEWVFKHPLHPVQSATPRPTWVDYFNKEMLDAMRISVATINLHFKMYICLWHLKKKHFPRGEFKLEQHCIRNMKKKKEEEKMFYINKIRKIFATLFFMQLGFCCLGGFWKFRIGSFYDKFFSRKHWIYASERYLRYWQQKFVDFSEVFFRKAVFVMKNSRKNVEIRNVKE